MKENSEKRVLSLIASRGLVVFPSAVVHFDIAREKSIKALENAMLNSDDIFITPQEDLTIELPTTDEISKFGTICTIKQMLKMPGENIRVLVEGKSRGVITKFTKDYPFFEAEVEVVKHSLKEDAELIALRRLVTLAYESYVNHIGKASAEAMMNLNKVDDVSMFADIVASNIRVEYPVKRELLSLYDVKDRLKKLLVILNSEIQILGLEQDIQNKLKVELNEQQKEYYLREQIKIIKSELGDEEDDSVDIAEYKEKLDKLNIDDSIKEKIKKEILKFQRASVHSPDKANLKNYLDLIFDMPFDSMSEEIDDISKTREILEQDHYGLLDVKERIVEHLAVRQMTDSYKGSIICLVGPPGVGKTSIVKSIARSMNRKFVRMSLGGVRDESEIRGHRRTYVGSMPGRIITLLKEAKTKNPVFLFDEIDKLASDFTGDPASALLEVLDPAQNDTFVDRYLEIPFDLSKVMFITTANTLSTIPRPLLDRMEVIELSSYTSYEKLEIAKKYLVKKQLKEHGLKKSMFKISDATLSLLIDSYTRESGVRNLERNIAKIMRKVVLDIVEEKSKSSSITKKNLSEYLGAPISTDDVMASKNQVGVVTGLAWTSVGGVTLEIEVSVLDGTGKLQLTGQMGDVMKESAQASLSYIRSRAKELGINPDFYKNKDIHIHIPEGATPKDGPSAGITMTTAIASALSGIAVKRDVAMTGEVTLRGRVFQIGGLKEKSLAAIRHGIKTIIIPFSNEKDLEKIPEDLKEKVTFVPVKHMDEVIKVAFEKKPKEYIGK